MLTASLLGAYSALGLAGFVFDDVALVVQNTLTGEPGRWLEAFRTDLWKTSGANEFSGYYRPLLLLDLTFDRALFGLSPTAHHLHSVAWHLLASGLFFTLLRRLVQPGPALVGAAIFALHPVQSEAVAWVAARNDLMAASFVFASLLALLPARPGGGRLAGGFVLALGGLLAKESAVIVPIALLALDLARDRRPGPLPRYLAALLAIAAWVAMRTAAAIPSASVPDSAQLAGLLAGLPTLGVHFAALLVFPSPLSIGEFLPYLRASSAQIVEAITLALGLAFALWRGRRLALAGLGIALIAFAPALLAIAVRGQIGERYLYFPLAGLALAVAAALPDHRAILGALVPFAFAWLAVLHLRLPDWTSDLSLWESAHADTPSPYTHHSLAAALVTEGRSAEAVVHYQAALDAPRPYLSSCLPAVTLPLRQGDTDAALRGARLVVAAHCPKSAPLAAAAGRAALDGGDRELAFRLVDGIDPGGNPELIALMRELDGVHDDDPPDP